MRKKRDKIENENWLNGDCEYLQILHFPWSLKIGSIEQDTDEPSSKVVCSSLSDCGDGAFI